MPSPRRVLEDGQIKSINLLIEREKSVMLIKQMLVFLATMTLSNGDKSVLESIVATLKRIDSLLDRIATTIETKGLKKRRTEMKLFKLCSECTHEFEIDSGRQERCPVCGNTQLTDVWPTPVETDDEWEDEEGLDYGWEESYSMDR